VKANGVDMEPTDSLGDATILQTGCQGLCRLSGTWWLALDLAEKAHPGMFVNVPIDVTFTGKSLFATTETHKISVTAT
jgi:hypothetical protein